MHYTYDSLKVVPLVFFFSASAAGKWLAMLEPAKHLGHFHFEIV